MQDTIEHPIVQAIVDVLGKIAVPTGFLLNMGKWFTDIPINGWVASITGLAGLIYIVYKIYNAHLDSKIKRQTLKNLQEE